VLLQLQAISRSLPDISAEAHSDTTHLTLFHSSIHHSMKLTLVKSLWGAPFPPDDPSEAKAFWVSLLSGYKAEGYSAVEAITLTFRDPIFITSLQEVGGLKIIPQLHSSGGDFKDGNYEYLTSTDVDDHVKSFQSLLSEVVENLQPKNLLIAVNVHSGHDSWAHTPNALEYFSRVSAIQKDSKFAGIQIFHETHRQRILFNPHSYNHGFTNTNVEHDLMINADLSHWACAGEHVMTSTELRDISWWPPTLSSLGKRCGMIHARIGNDQAPQVNDPRLSIHDGTVASHFEWWTSIWKDAAARGVTEFFVTTEFGPEPYFPCGVKGERLADLDEINAWMKERIIVSYRTMDFCDQEFTTTDT
jgi:hypothetical protein